MLCKYLLHLARWQLSTPVPALCVVYSAQLGELTSTIVANLIGGLIFFWIDRFIFSGRIAEPIWNVREDNVCVDCGLVRRGYRLVAAPNYDRRQDDCPKFRCEKCSTAKLQSLQSKGVVVQ